MSDDDLPVLTHVLRAGTRSTAALEDRFTTEPPDATPIETPLLPDPLVVGDEQQPAIGAYLAPTDLEPTDDAGATVDDAADDHGEATAPHAHDVFGLPQDHDGATSTRPSMLDVPEFGAATAGGTADVTDTSDAPAVLARRIRDAVVDDLRTRIDTELDARIAQALHAEVEAVLAQLQQNLRAHLSDALRDVVAKAVDDAIARPADTSAPPGA